MTSVCPRCSNFTLYCICASVTTSGSTTLLPSVPPKPAIISTLPLTEEQVRKIVSEEVRKALQDEADEDAVSPTPRIVRIAEKTPMLVKFEYEGVLYAGEVYPVEETYG